MPELLQHGLPERTSRSKFDFNQWTDGQAWKFVKGKDYDSSTETFRYNVRRWAKANGLEVECRPVPAIDREGNEIPITKADAMALAVRFQQAGEDGNESDAAGNGAGSRV
jgi:hypothetical protein